MSLGRVDASKYNLEQWSWRAELVQYEPTSLRGLPHITQYKLGGPRDTPQCNIVISLDAPPPPKQYHNNLGGHFSEFLRRKKII